MNRVKLSLMALSTVFGLSAVAGVAAPPRRAPAFVAPAATQSAKSTTAEKVKWHSDMKTAHKEATASGKPIMVVFGADWCTYCKKLESQTLSSPDLVKYINENFIPVHLDLDKEKQIGAILEVESLPCTVVLSPEADLLGKINGYYTPGPFRKNLAEAKSRFQPANSPQAVVPVKGTVR